MANFHTNHTKSTLITTLVWSTFSPHHHTPSLGVWGVWCGAVGKRGMNPTLHTNPH